MQGIDTRAPAPSQELQDDRKALTEAVRAAHLAVCSAAQSIVREAITAGAALLKLKKLVNHGEFGHYLRRHCELGERTAQIYMQLAQHREVFEANPQRAADLSLRGALRLIGKSSSKSAERTKSAKTPPALSSLAWSNATPEQRRHFLDGIGLVSLLAAIPPTWTAEIERRVEGLHKAKTDKLSDAVTKALRHALSLQRAHKDKDQMAPGVAAALNTINNLLDKAGADLNEIDGIIFDRTLTKAKSAA